VEKVQGDPEKIADAFHVENLILTTVTTQGESLILDVILAEGATQKVRWARPSTGRPSTRIPNWTCSRANTL
jgi:hypothetical protein